MDEEFENQLKELDKKIAEETKKDPGFLKNVILSQTSKFISTFMGTFMGTVDEEVRNLFKKQYDNTSAKELAEKNPDFASRILNDPFLRGLLGIKLKDEIRTSELLGKLIGEIKSKESKK